jgi:hypothetical protein
MLLLIISLDEKGIYFDGCPACIITVKSLWIANMDRTGSEWISRIKINPLNHNFLP